MGISRHEAGEGGRLPRFFVSFRMYPLNQDVRLVKDYATSTVM